MLSATTGTFDEARFVCKKLGGSLAKSSSAEGNEALTKLVADHDLEGVWIAANDIEVEGLWRWADQPEDSTFLLYSNWAWGNPDNGGAGWRSKAGGAAASSSDPGLETKAFSCFPPIVYLDDSTNWVMHQLEYTLDLEEPACHDEILSPSFPCPADSLLALAGGPGDQAAAGSSGGMIARGKSFGSKSLASSAISSGTSTTGTTTSSGTSSRTSGQSDKTFMKMSP